jgi:RNA polymerase sigma-70 factor (ECF subfamily)
MTDDEVEFRRLITRVREGNPEAALELLELYSPHVLRLIRRRLSPKMRAKFDSADFVQGVWVAFFCEGQTRDFERPEDLIRFLVTIARNKLYDETRRRTQSERYNVSREQSLDDTELTGEQELEAIDLRQPRPSEIAVARERWTKLLADQPPLYRKILELRCRGATFLEIADQLQVHERTARRVFERLTQDLSNS